MAAVPNTEMAKVFTGGLGRPGQKFLQLPRKRGHHEHRHGHRPASWNRLNNFYFDLMAKMAGKDASSEEVRKLKKLATDATNSLGGTLAASFSMDAKTKPPFELQYVVGSERPAGVLSRDRPVAQDLQLRPDRRSQQGIRDQVRLRAQAQGRNVQGRADRYDQDHHGRRPTRTPRPAR